MQNIESTLHIKDLVLDIHLGWTEQERIHKQTVLLNLDVRFAVPPKACETDELENTFCYDELILHIREALSNKHFRLIEHLTVTIYQLARSYLSPTAAICASVTKHPSIQDLSGGVCFRYGDPI